jgi:hypothetical protein
MELRPSWETANCAATQKLPSILWNPKVLCRVHNSLPLVPNLSQINPLHITHLRLGLPSGLFPSSFPTKSYMHFSTLFMRATFPAHLIFLDLIILIMLRKDYKLWSSSLCTYLQPPVTSSLFGPNILLNTLFSNTLSLCSSLNARDPYRTTGKFTVLYILIFSF